MTRAGVTSRRGAPSTPKRSTRIPPVSCPASTTDTVRPVPSIGATDALMSYGGAAAAMLSGPVLVLIGYHGLALACATLLVPAAAIGWVARRHRRLAGDPDPAR